MDLQTRKIEFIQEFLKVQSEEVILRLEKLLHKETKLYTENNFEPITIAEFDANIDTAMDDSANDRGVSSTDLKEEIKKW